MALSWTQIWLVKRRQTLRIPPGTGTQLLRCRLRQIRWGIRWGTGTRLSNNAQLGR